MEKHFFKFSIFSNFPNLTCAISNRSYGDMKLKDMETSKNRENFFQNLGIETQDIIVPHQVHSNNVVVVSQKDKGKGAVNIESTIAATDGLITSEKRTYLMILTADCLPILVYDPILEIVGAVHAGWRGLLEQIILRTIDKFIDLGSNAENLIVGIGPAICQKHFVVKNDVLKEFQDSYQSATMVRNNDGYIDLKKVAVIDLKKANVLPSNIEMSHFCTVCDNGIYGSFRKEGSGAPEMASIIGIKNIV